MKVMLPVAFLLLMYSSSRGQDTFYSHGNVFVVSKPEHVSISDPVSGNIIDKIVPGTFTFLNGARIYSRRELDSPPMIVDANGNSMKLSEYIFHAVKGKLALLEDGLYILDITNPVTDTQGHLVYYEMKGVKQIMGLDAASGKKAQPYGETKGMVYTEFSTDDGNIPPGIRNEINNSVIKTLERLPTLKSGRKGNSPVNTTGYLFSIENPIVVEKNAVTIVDDFFSL